MSNRNAIKFTTKGSLLGYKINTTGTQFPRDIAKALGKSRSNIINDLRKIFKARVRDRIPKLRTQLINGFKGGNFQGANLQKTIGTAQFEGTPGNHSNHSHRVHKDIPDIWSRIIKQGLNIKVVNKGKSAIQVVMRFSNSRKSSLRYHYKTKTPPKVTKLVRRLEETCLAYMGSGNFSKTVEQWGMYNQISMYSEIRKYIKNNKSVR